MNIFKRVPAGRLGHGLRLAACLCVVVVSVGLGDSRARGDELPEPAITFAPTAEQIAFFETKIRPLLAEHCYDCHGPDLQESRLRVDSWAALVAGGTGGPSIVPRKPQGSLLLTAVRYDDADLRMPPDAKLSASQIADLTRWVELGAPHPDSGKTSAALRTPSVDLAAGRKHWAFQPLIRPTPPPFANARSEGATEADTGFGLGSNAIDAFLGRAQRERSLKPRERADKRTLIRRATFDLIGLPPTPEEVSAFLADDSAGAFARVVDRLLQSPHYGERWARHWLDLARYADSNGLDENVVYGNAWRYRDYVVRSLNADNPYDEFLTEQIAGDLLPPCDDAERQRDRLIATGFLTLGPKVLAEVDKSKLEMDIIDEQLDTLGRSTMGLTLGCARCHDHKFDPISQRDYYALAGIFRSTRTMETLKTVARWQEHSIATPEQLRSVEAYQQRLDEKQRLIDETANAALRALPHPAGQAVSAGQAGQAGQAVSADQKLTPALEAMLPANIREELARLRAELKSFEETAPEPPTAMGLSEGEVADLAVHLRGSHLTLGDVVPRGFPQVLAGEDQPLLPTNYSGRRELARWLTAPSHPLTARVMVNRLWRWHFGVGLVESVDNFGRQATPPMHPELLDWLAVEFVEQGWSLKRLHRLILLSDAWQRSSDYDARNAELDPENTLYWRRDIQRLDAESLRDGLLAVSGLLDSTAGGSLLPYKNREYVFNHTSQDASTYHDIRRRSLYVPVIRNHLYDLFQLFDYTDADVLNGDRDTSTLAPQALLLMNSELMAEVSAALAARVRNQQTDAERVGLLFALAYGRPPRSEEQARIASFLTSFAALARSNTAGLHTAGSNSAGSNSDSGHGDEIAAWEALCQSILSSSEFLYVR